MYLDLLLKNKTSILSPSQIRDGWIKHIKAEEEKLTVEIASNVNVIIFRSTIANVLNKK